jgi:hypothetical protein
MYKRNEINAMIKSSNVPKPEVLGDCCGSERILI